MTPGPSPTAPRRPTIAAALAVVLTCFLPAFVAGQHAPGRAAGPFDGLRLRSIGPANMSGRIVDLAVVEANPFTFYVASATGGVWKTVNNGVTFTPVFDREATHSVGDIAVHQVDTALVWVGTGERANRQSSSWGDGVYLSEDGGRTWRNTGLRDSHHIGRIALHPTNPDIVFVAAMGHLWGPNRERGLYRSTDRGVTWKRVLYVDSVTGVVDVAIDPSDPDIMYAATYQRERKAFGFHGGGPGSGLWKSEDGGDTWRLLGPERTGVPGQIRAWDGTGDPPTVHGRNGLPVGDYGRIGISIYRSDPRIVYASVEQGWRFNASTAYVARRAGLYRSEDRGETWEWMSDWNPRPMYASQPVVDPSDDQRVYMMNSFSWSDDGGRTFDVARQSLHGDDRFVWVDPTDSRHVIKADDGGVGISYDRAGTWLYVTDLPVSQYYRVAVDNAVPFRIYGGLQDNGAWVGPSATYRREGILNEDWTRIGGGDGFTAVPDTTDPDVFYAASQYLGVSRLRRSTLETRSIRPGDPTGAIGDRRNFDWFFSGEPEGELSNAMAPANWDAPYIISPHDPKVLYAGTDHLWKSEDRGATWRDLGGMTTGTDRRELEIMGQPVDDWVPSIDDGIPYWPTLTVIAESPVQEGLLYVGTDDGRFRVSRDGGMTWTDLYDRLPDAPDGAWIAGIEASRHDAGTVYVVLNDYRNDDYANYLFRSTDGGRSFAGITGDLPPERVLRTVREDPRNPRVLWLGTELGAFVSRDAGMHWTPLTGGLPTVAVNDLVVHPRDNDLVLATHGRGIWILDNVNAFQELSPAVARSEAHLFTIEPAAQVRLASEKAHTGDMAFHGQNPPEGAIIDYWLGTARDSGAVAITIHDRDGATIAAVPATGRQGVNRVVWNLAFADLPRRPGSGGGFFGRRGLSGPPVLPGTYTVRLAVDGRVRGERAVRVREDPRLALPDSVRAAWTADLRSIAAVYREAVAQLELLQPLRERLAAADTGEARPLDRATAASARTLADELDELASRVTGVYFEVLSWTGPMTADQRSTLDFVRRKLAGTRQRTARLR